MSSFALVSSLDSTPNTSQIIITSAKKQRRRKIKEKLECLVCGGAVIHKHFLGQACNSCAAFYRRSVSQRRSYFCRQNEACQIDQRKYKNRCSYCRFQRCLEINMEITKVVSNGIKAYAEKLSSHTIIDQFQRHHNANFILRRKFAIQLFGSYNHMWDQRRTAPIFLNATNVEKLVMRDFFRSIELVDKNHVESEFEKEFCAQMLPLWMLLEIVFITRMHGGQRSKKLYYVDDSFLEFNEDSLLAFYNSHQNVYNSTSLARMCMSLFEKYFKVIELIHRLSIDECERMVIIAICIHRRAVAISGPNVQMQSLLNEMFRDLKLYYENTFNSLPLRLGNLMSCVEAIEEAHIKIVQQLTIVSLNLKNATSGQQNCYSVSYYKS